MAVAYVDTLSDEAQVRYRHKLKAIGSDLCPFSIDSGAWLNDPSQWPDVQYGDVYNYLIESPGVFSKDTMKNYKSLEAHQFFRSGWVHDILHLTTTTRAVLLKAKVRRSQRVTETPHTAWVAVKEEGVVLAGHCTCMAGLGESCSHVAAILFKIEAAVRLGCTSTTPTDVACKWNASYVKNVVPSRVAEMDLVHKDATEERPQQPHISVASASDDDSRRDEFLTHLAASGQSVCLSLFDKTCHVFQCDHPVLPAVQLPISLRSLYDSGLCSASTEDIKQRCDNVNISLSADDIECVYNATVPQANCDEWFQQRAGRITASTAHRVLHTSMKTPSKSLLLQLTSDRRSSYNVPSLLHGREGEQRALDFFDKQLPDLHTNARITRCGLRISADYPWLGASPDGLLHCDCHGTCTVEVKCPYSFKDSSVSDMLGSSHSCLDENGELKQTHEYYTQMQVQMLVCNVRTGILLLLISALVIVNVDRNDDFLENAILHLHSFWHEHVLPELLTRRLETATASDTGSHGDPVGLYCYGDCDTSSTDSSGQQFIRCHGDNCPHGGFIHLQCIRPKRKCPPKGKWLCKSCKKK